MFRPKDEKERVIHRLKIAKGHLDKVIKMIEDDAYCIDVLHQSQAIQSALKEADNVLLEHHLRHCTKEALENGRYEQAMTEVLAVFKKKGN